MIYYCLKYSYNGFVFIHNQNIFATHIVMTLVSVSMFSQRLTKKFQDCYFKFAAVNIRKSKTLRYSFGEKYFFEMCEEAK